MARCGMLVAILTLIAVSAGAQLAPQSEGRLAAFADMTIPDNASFSVDILDDTDLNLRLAEALSRTLAARKSDAPSVYVISFNASEIHNLEGDGGGVGKLVIDVDAGVDLHMNLWSSTRDALLSGRSTPRSVTVLRLDLAVHAPGRGPLVWQAQAFSEPGGADYEQVYGRMMVAMLAHLGETVAEEVFATD